MDVGVTCRWAVDNSSSRVAGVDQLVNHNARQCCERSEVSLIRGMRDAGADRHPLGRQPTLGLVLKVKVSVYSIASVIR